MNRQDLQLLQQIKGYPTVTITLPTHRHSPENQQDPIRVRNLLKQAHDRLLQEFTARECKPLMDRLEQLAQGIDYRRTLDGLTLIANADFARASVLPFPLRERVVVDATAFTRDLVFALNRTPRYWTLVLSEKPTRLFEGTRETLVELRNGSFPLVHEGPGGEQPLPGGFGVRKSAHRDERHRQFFRAVDAALRSVLAEDPLPLAVVGVDRYLAFFNEVTQHAEAVLATLTGSHDKTPAPELGALVWPLVERSLAARREEVLAQLEQAVGERKSASSVDEVWRLAQEGRGRLLVVEEDFHYPARLDASGTRLLPAPDREAPGVIDDAVDEIIEAVLSKQGQVVFVDRGQLGVHHGIALILRY